MIVRIASKRGIFRSIEAEETRAPGVVLHESYGNPGYWTLTHRWTGFCFFGLLPTRRHATAIAAVLAAIGNWDVRTMPGIIGVFHSLPATWQAWIKDLQEDFNSDVPNDPQAVAKALRQLRNSHRSHTRARA